MDGSRDPSRTAGPPGRHSLRQGWRRLRRAYRLFYKRVWLTPKRRKRLKRSARRLYDRRHRHAYAATIDLVPSRDELPALLNRRGLTGEGAEIGVKLGKYSDYLLDHWRGRRLVSIDPWLEAGSKEYVDRSNVSQSRHEEFYEESRRRLARHGERSEIWRTTSIEAAGRVPDHSLDFVYIDARHDYDSVSEDLEAWFPKVRPGGIVAGHDYVDGHFPSGVFGVKSAVDEFFGARQLAVHGTHDMPPLFPSWIVMVPLGPADMAQPVQPARSKTAL